MKDNRIPQPSIINSATGNMNQFSHKGQENEQPYLSQHSNLNHSKTHIDPAIMGNNAKTPTNNSNVGRGLQNPRIIDKKFNIAVINKNQIASGENSN